MRTQSLLLLLSLTFMTFAARAADKPAEVPAEKEGEAPPRAARPALPAVKLSPRVRESAPRPDESGRMKRETPPRGESPLQNVPALMDPPPGAPAPAKP